MASRTSSCLGRQRGQLLPAMVDPNARRRLADKQDRIGGMAGFGNAAQFQAIQGPIKGVPFTSD